MKHSILLIITLLIFGTSSAQRYKQPIFQESRVSKNIKYGENINYLNTNEELYLDIYEPKNDNETLRPVIVYIHGGGFTDKNQSKELLHIIAFADSFARRGYVVATINYRLDSTISNRAIVNAMHDAKAAVRFLRKNASTYQIDTDYIFIGGESAGAITSLNTTYLDKANEINYPPTNPQSLDKTVEGTSGSSGFSSKTTAVLCLCGGTKTVLNDLLFDTTAIETSKDAPLLFLHGTSDPLISVPASLEIALRAKNLGVPQLYYPLYGATHCPWFYPLNNSWKYLDTLVDYTSSFLYAFVQHKNTGLSNLEESQTVAYPNPSHDDVFVQLEQIMGDKVSITAINAIGQSIDLSYNQKENKLLQIITSKLENGLYIISIKQKNSKPEMTFRFMKQ